MMMTMMLNDGDNDNFVNAISFYKGEDIVNKLDPGQNANVECFVNTSRCPGCLKLKDTTLAENIISRSAPQTGDVIESRLQTENFKSQNEGFIPKSDALRANKEDEV